MQKVRNRYELKVRVFRPPAIGRDAGLPLRRFGPRITQIYPQPQGRQKSPDREQDERYPAGAGPALAAPPDVL